jgi:hypothetical protein
MTADAAADAAMARALEALEEAAELGDNLARHVAAIMRGRSCGGPPPIDDDAALADLSAAGDDAL